MLNPFEILSFYIFEKCNGHELAHGQQVSPSISVDVSPQGRRDQPKLDQLGQKRIRNICKFATSFIRVISKNVTVSRQRILTGNYSSSYKKIEIVVAVIISCDYTRAALANLRKSVWSVCKLSVSVVHVQ